MAFFYLRIAGKRTPCFVTQGQEVEDLEDLAITTDKKEEFINTLTGKSFTHNTLIKIAAALDVLPDDARKADKEDYARAIYNKLVGKKPPCSSSSSSKKKKDKKETSSDSESSGEERRKARKAAKAKKDKKDKKDEGGDESEELIPDKVRTQKKVVVKDGVPHISIDTDSVEEAK